MKPDSPRFLGHSPSRACCRPTPKRGFSTLPLSVDDLVELTRARIVIESSTLRESIAVGDLSWEGSVVAAHHRLAATPMYNDDNTINDDFANVHRAFHVAPLAGSGNSHLEGFASSLRDRSELYQYWSRYLGDGPNRDVACEHRELADLTVARKTSSAADALERHIQRTTDFLIEYIRTHSLEER